MVAPAKRLAHSFSTRLYSAWFFGLDNIWRLFYPLIGRSNKQRGQGSLPTGDETVTCVQLASSSKQVNYRTVWLHKSFLDGNKVSEANICQQRQPSKSLGREFNKTRLSPVVNAGSCLVCRQLGGSVYDSQWWINRFMIRNDGLSPLMIRTPTFDCMRVHNSWGRWGSMWACLRALLDNYRCPLLPNSLK